MNENEDEENQVELKLQNGLEIPLNDDKIEIQITRNEHCH